jgi:hypothetical protein
MQCDANGQPEGTMKHAEYKLMERYMHRYWGNFVRNGDPNDETGSWYPDIIKVRILFRAYLINSSEPVRQRPRST